MSLHLAEIAKQVAPGAHAVLVLHGAGCHGTARTRGLNIPATITLLHLPPASPELNVASITKRSWAQVNQ